MIIYRIDQMLAQALVNYLATKPWIEVKDFIPALMTLKTIPAKEPDGLAEKRNTDGAS